MKIEKMKLKNSLNLYLELLDNKQYFEAHEVLEEAWHPMRKAKHPLSNLVKGLINGAICFEHIKRNKKESKRKAIQVLKSYERHKHLCNKEIEYFELFNRCCKKVEELKEIYL